MAGTTTDKKTAIINLAEEIRKSKTEQKKTTETKVDVEELASLIEELKKKRKENTVANKAIKNVAQKIDKATNPTTYLKAVIPKMFKTFHENLETYDKERAATKQLEKQQAAARKSEVDTFMKSMKALIDNNEQLSDIQKRYGQAAAQQAALNAEESKALLAAENEYIKNMAKIDERLGNINDDARAEWAKQKGTQLVKIVEDEPSKEALNEIKAELSKQIEADANKYEQEKIAAKKTATDERRYIEGLMKEQSWFRKFWSKKGDDKKEKGNSLLGNLLGAWAIESLLPMLIKGGILAGLIAGFNKYFNDPEFKAKVDEGIGKLWKMMKEFMEKYWKETLLALALMFPGQTLSLIAGGLQLLATLLNPSLATGVITLFRGLASVMMGPAGVIALLALFAVGLTNWLEENTEWGREAKKNRELQPADPQTIPVPADKPRTESKPVTTQSNADSAEFKEEVERRAVKRASELFMKGGMIIRNADGTYTDTYLKVLNTYRREEGEKLQKEIDKKKSEVKKPELKTPAPATPAAAVAPPEAPAGGTQQTAAAVTMNAPTVNNNRSVNTTLMTAKSAIDPSRGIIFENRA
jgi:hypothetical protein